MSHPLGSAPAALLSDPAVAWCDAAMARPRVLPLGDTALSVEFGDRIDPAISEIVLAFERRVAAAELPGLIETVPSYRTLTILYDPGAIRFAALAVRLRALAADPAPRAEALGRTWTVPVAYDPPFGLDLREVAAELGTPAARIRALHLAARYRVYMVGFAPGFTYLGGLPPGLALPRRATPRAEVPAGAVMIAGGQAAIGAQAIPTGWHVLGRTPLRAFDPDRADPFLFRPGDGVRFRAIAPPEFDRLAALPDADLVALARDPAETPGGRCLAS